MKREELRKLLPWPEPKGTYDNDGAECDVTINGHAFEVRNSGDIGMDTGRTRWKVTCVTCKEEIHRGSTSATVQIESHLNERQPTPRAEPGQEKCQHLSAGRMCSGVAGHSGPVHTLWKKNDSGAWVPLVSWLDSDGKMFVPTPHSNVPARNEDIADRRNPSDPTGEIQAVYVPSEPRNIVDVLTQMIEKIPKLPNDDKTARWDPATELWRTETLRDRLKALKTDAEYAPPEAHQHFWMRGAVLARENFPDHLVMNVLVNGKRVDGLTLKRAGQRVPDAATDSWERAVMRVWIPKHFVEGGRWHLTTNSGGSQ